MPSRKRNERTMVERVANELIEASTQKVLLSRRKRIHIRWQRQIKRLLTIDGKRERVCQEVIS